MGSDKQVGESELHLEADDQVIEDGDGSALVGARETVDPAGAETPHTADVIEPEPEPFVPAGPQPIETWYEALPETEDGTVHQIRIIRFGEAEARPKAYIQSGLHADELPGQLVIRELIKELTDAAERGLLIGQVVIVPQANPIGLSQVQGGYLQGRVEQGSGRNFNRDFPDLAALARRRIVGKFDTEDAAKNIDKIRGGMAKALNAMEPADAFEAQQVTLLKHASDADVVLDLHADNEALLHIYTEPDFWPEAHDLAAELDARAVLLCDNSGGSPFDEACSQPWAKLAKKQASAAIPRACFSATVELRSNNDVDPREARRDAIGLYRFLMRRAIVSGMPGALPRLLCEATALDAMQQVKAPVAGLVIYKLRLGDSVRVGDVIAEIVPLEGDPIEVKAVTDGKLFARHNQVWAWEGKVIAKIAGAEPLPDRTGHLLTD
ncbi:MAG: succinylglutamate desuccinylase/aspartoacylase family protein [Pseudomonadota bacterium]